MAPAGSEVLVLSSWGTADDSQRGCPRHVSQPRLLHFFLRLLLQGSDFGSRFAFAGVSVVYREQLKAIGVADGLPEGALFIQQLLNGFILPQFIVLDYLKRHIAPLDGQWWC